MEYALRKWLDSTGNDELFTCTSAAMEAGNAIIRKDFPQEASRKDDIYVGHHAITVEADSKAQAIILMRLHHKFPHAYFIAEEGGEEILDSMIADRILTGDNYSGKLGQLVFGVDPLDGTSQYSNGLYEWGISIGAMSSRIHTTGAIYSPEVMNGLVVFGTRTQGTYFMRGNQHKVKEAKVAEDKTDRNSLVLFGVDILLDPGFGKFVNNISNHVRTASVIGSCALGLALVAIGAIDAIIQPCQRVWDWYGGYPLVLGSGGKMQFYRLSNHRIMTIDTPETDDYSPVSRSLGFIAGRSNFVARLVDELIGCYRRCS